jgi:hypothetical protein
MLVFEGENERCSKFISKDYNLDQKIWKVEVKMEGILYYCKGVNWDVNNSCENA